MRVIITDKWDSYLSFFDEKYKDIYFKEEYVKLYETIKEKGVCIVVQEGGQLMLFPFLQRHFEYKGKLYYDFETAYGYGGPIFNTEDEGFIQKSLDESYKFLSESGFICGFVRFHTLIDTYKYFDKTNILFDRYTVAMDLSLSEDYIWKTQIHSKNRNVIKKGEKAGLRFVVEDSFEHIQDFIHLYNNTMARLGADDFYYFNQKYYDTFIQNIKKSFLGLVLLEEKVVSAAMFMYEGHYGHYHLSGSDRDYLYCSPNNFMLYHAALELKKRGVTVFHLGGGTTSSDDDSLFAFKSKFSPNRYKFHLGKFVFNKPLYDEICDQWIIDNPDKVEKYKHYLLKYKY
jgi:hypothetical protein